jgi:hypothetical protein
LLSFLLAPKDIFSPFCSGKKELDTACKIKKIPENKKVLHAAIELLPAKGSLMA